MNFLRRSIGVDNMDSAGHVPQHVRVECIEFLEVFECHKVIARLTPGLNRLVALFGRLGQENVQVRIPYVPVVKVIVRVVIGHGAL